MTDTAHSPLGPSAAERWINCPGSVNATRGIPDTSSEFAAEGSFAHLISEMSRNQGKPAKEFIGYKGKVDGYEFTCDAYMARMVQYFNDYVSQWPCDEELVEVRVSYDAWADGGFGTLDAALLDDGTVIIADLKYGKGIQVHAQDNAQLKLYALGIFQEYAELYDIQAFKLVIVQPRLDWIDEWEISLEELLVWADEVVEPAADEALTDTARFKAGPWCDKNFCKIRGTCKTRYEMVKNALLDELQDIRDPAEMSNEELGEALDLVPLIKKWCNEIWARGEKLVLSGQKIIGIDGEPYKMVAGRGSRSWRSEEEAEKAFRNYKIRVDDFMPRSLISPAQAEKLPKVGKGHPIIEKQVINSPGKPALVPGSDPRPEYKISVDEMDDEGDDVE